jgi:uncharacterized protein
MNPSTRARRSARQLIVFLCILAAGCGTAPNVVPSPVGSTSRPTDPATVTPSLITETPAAADTHFTVQPAAMDARYAAALPRFDYDRKTPLDIEVQSSTEHAGIILDTITYASSTGESVPAVIAHPRKPAGLPGVIWQGPGGPVVERAEALALLGTAVITINPPQARPSGNLALTFTDADRDQLVELMIELRRAVDVLIASGADPNRIAFIGYSWGGAMGGALSGIEHRIGSYNLMFADGGVVEHVLETPNRDFAPLSGAELDRWLATMEPLESLYFVRHAAPSAFLFQNGLHDEEIAEVSARRLHEMASEPKDIRWYDSGHDPTPDAPEVWCEQAEWLKDQLELSSSDVAECSQT